MFGGRQAPDASWAGRAALPRVLPRRRRPRARRLAPDGLDRARRRPRHPSVARAREATRDELAALGAHVDGRGVCVRGVLEPSPTASSCACSTTAAPSTASALETRRGLRLARPRRRGGAGRPLRLPGPRPVGPGLGCALQPGQAVARSLRARDLRCACSWHDVARWRQRRRLGAVHAALGRLRQRSSTGAASGAPDTPLERLGDLRAARQGLHEAPPAGAAPSCAGTYRGLADPAVTEPPAARSA